MSCSNAEQSKEISSVLNNQETRHELFNAIQNDHEMMTDFMQSAQDNQHAMMMMMMGNGQMMGNNGQMGMNNHQHMMGQNYMMNMMHNNPGRMDTIMNNMISAYATDSVMSRNMFKGMSQYPQMMQMMKGYMNSHQMIGSPTQGMMNGNNSQMKMK